MAGDRMDQVVSNGHKAMENEMSVVSVNGYTMGKLILGVTARAPCQDRRRYCLCESRQGRERRGPG